MFDTGDDSRKFTRRSLLGRGSTIAAAAAGSTWLASCSADETGDAAGAASPGPRLTGDRLVLLGTAGGPVWWPGTDRRGISSAVVAGGKVYVVDCGEGSGERIKQAGLVAPAQENEPRGGLERLRGMFLTHLHSDHTIDYFNFFLYGWSNGIEDVESPVDVYGPGPRGSLEPLFRPNGETIPEPRVINPANPTPGTVEMTEYLSGPTRSI